VTPDSGTTLYVYDAAGRMVTKVDAYGSAGEQTHTFTYDHLGRLLTEQRHGSCGAGAPTELEYVYDAPPVTCPTGADCLGTTGRLAYARATLLCSSSYADNALDQETFYSYDDAGRVVREFLQDDAGRTANTPFSYTKNGGLSQVTTPTGAAISWTYGGAGNSETDRVVSMARGATTLASAITWYPFGSLKSYQHANRRALGDFMKTVITRNLADRVSDVLVEGASTGTDVFRVAITEDAKGRVTARDYTGGDTGLTDAYFLYDPLDRLTCETTTFASTCPTFGSTLKNNISGGYTASNDRGTFLRPRGTNLTHQVALVSGKDQLDTINQTGAFGDGVTDYGWDSRGNRTYDDNATHSNDDRDFYYDGRGNLVSVQGWWRVAGNWHSYTLTNAYDHRNRRVFKSFKDTTSGKEAQWFFYYDAFDRLTEIKHTPDIASPSTYSIYQLAWLDDRLILYWQIDYPNATVSRRYVHTDETGRAVEMYSWPGVANAARVWAINPDAWRMDTSLLGTAVFAPVVSAGEYRDIETIAYTSGGAEHRPAIILGRRRAYDPFAGTYLQADSGSWGMQSYVFAANNPVTSRSRGASIIKSMDSGGSGSSFRICGWHTTSESYGPPGNETIIVYNEAIHCDDPEWDFPDGGGGPRDQWPPQGEGGDDGGGGGDFGDGEGSGDWESPMQALCGHCLHSCTETQRRDRKKCRDRKLSETCTNACYDKAAQENCDCRNGCYTLLCGQRRRSCPTVIPPPGCLIDEGLDPGP
jgi:hypothetical protein